MNYDFVAVKCPKCQREVFFQNTAGPLGLNTYNLNDAPFQVRADLVGQEVICPCGVTDCVGGRMNNEVI